MSLDVSGRIHSVESFGAVDGPGIRFVVFLQGCNLRCLYCHNPDSWNLGGGTKILASELISQIKGYKNFIKKGGVTFSGGEPLLQSAFVKAVILGCKEMGLHTAIDTSGAVPLAVSFGAIDEADLILLDIKSTDDFMSRTVTGCEKVFENTKKTLDYCEKINKSVWIRHVILPYYTLNQSHLENLAKLLSSYKCIEKVELLPFHKMGEYKWEQLGFEYKLKDVPPPSIAQMNAVRKVFEDHGLIVK